jgi:amino acid transporter
LSYARVPFAMAEDRWLPTAFTKLNRFGVPWVSVIACAIAWVAALSLGFVKLIELDVAIYGLSLLLEFAAMIALRLKEPELARPFRVPGGLPGAVLIAIGPTVLVGLAIFDSLHHHVTYLGLTFNNLGLSSTIALLGVLQYWLIARRARGQS